MPRRRATRFEKQCSQQHYKRQETAQMPHKGET